MKYLKYCTKAGVAALLSLSMLAGCGPKKVEESEQLTQAPVTETVTPSQTETPPPTQETTPEATPEVTVIPTQESTEPVEEDWLIEKLNELKESNPEYESYESETFQAGDWCYAVYAEAGQDKDDPMNYVADIWAVSKDKLIQLEEDNCIVPDACDLVEIDGESYFRYSIAYATESQTQLCIGLEDDCRIIQIGGAISELNGNQITFTRSAYDLCYNKDDDMGLGHTWKSYYGYIKDHDFYEYEAAALSEEEFLAYDQAAEIKERLTKEYDTNNYKVSFEYFKRENDLIHVNIYQESETEIVNHYETERINGNKLEKVEDGEGRY